MVRFEYGFTVRFGIWYSQLSPSMPREISSRTRV